ncbi:PREDICTED: protein trichome birefringence-like 34 [Ipomoea nil]|uniref:protein trichome birefringence-like 34 n=1 Tax=Ipomoea nil TaxID=35883 RepID=UPI000901A2EA|nr:PREDICTED: protein trichome birefringence-like 34 [Ipomoea nil]XP_019162594.1 PREDICTED: protein trichome birefringence-like 34 [Ipomoea nil]
MAKAAQQLLAAPSAAVPGIPAGSLFWDIRCSFHSLTAVLIVGLVIGVVFLAGETQNFLSVLNLQQNTGAINHSSSSTKCDLFSGKWVYDNKSYPLYKEQECTFMSDQLACQKFGRKDLDYQHWRWQPDHCDLPRFNATEVLERLRNKRLVYVGDSLNRGQWVSMVCLLDSAIPPSLKSMHYKYNSSLTIFKAREYNASVEFYWAPLLVESNSDDPTHHRLPERIVRANAIEKHGSRWTDADFLVFNTYLWWTRPGIKVLWGSFERSGDGIYKVIEMQRSYEMALKTWSDWLEIHVNRSKTQLFFITMSPVHERAELWGKEEGENCYGETELVEEEYLQRQVNVTDTKMMETVQSTINGLKGRGLQVQLMNITQLTRYRREGHPSIYRKQWEPLTQDQIANPSTYADCIHWCLPGVSDVWNELLYAHIFNYV